MTRLHVLGFLVAPLIALHCIWHGQRQANPEARLLLVPEAAVQSLRR
jgi:DMSO/TMAO reductase YedYZ heme-binding membrane subunit